MRMTIPWHAWYGDEELSMTFPDDWAAQAYWPNDAPDLDDDAIEAAFDAPLGTLPLEALVRERVAQGKRTVAIAVDDISRPTPASRLLPPLMRRLEMGGIDLDDVCVVLAVGMHRLMTKEEMRQKLGPIAVDRLDVYNSYQHGNLTDFGHSDRGTPIKVSSHFGDADIKIGIGSIAPHGGPGFGGGGKIVIPGVASFETVAAIHKPGRLKSRLLDTEDNELRADIEDMAGKIGLDAIINVVMTSKRGIAGAFVGHYIEAHRAAVELAKEVYATEIPASPVDVAICNAYPKDTDFMQSGLSLNILSSARLIDGRDPIVKEDGTIVIVTASPEGRGHHALYSPGMVYGRRGGDWRVEGPSYHGRPIAYFSPNVTPQDARNLSTFRAWEGVLGYLKERHDRPSVAVFPCGALQIAAPALV